MVPMDKKFTWVLKKFSSLEERKCYSPTFAVAGCNWRLLAYPKGRKKNGYFGVYLELADPSSLPPGWSRDVKFSLAVVSKGWHKSNVVLGYQCCFSEKTKSWGYDDLVCLTKLHTKREGFLMNDRLVIRAKLHVLPATVVPVKVLEHLSSKEGNQASGLSVDSSSSSQVEQKAENVSKDDDVDTCDESTNDGDNTFDQSIDDEDGSWEEVEGNDVSVGKSPGKCSDQVEHKTKTASEENLNGNDDTSDQDTDDDGNTSDQGVDDVDGSWEQVGCNDVSVGKSPGKCSDQVEQKTKTASEENLNGDDESVEGSSDDGDNTSDEGTDVDGSWEEVVASDDASSAVSDNGSRSHSNVLEEASHSVGNNGIKAAETEVSNGDNEGDSSHVSSDGARDLSSSQAVENGTEATNILKEIQPAKETLDVNGFMVLTSQVKSVSQIFKRHPDTASGFNSKNQQIRRVYMNELLSLIETLCKSPEELSEDDLSNAEDTLGDLIDAGFKLDWLKTKLNEVCEKKTKEQYSMEQIQIIEEELQKVKLMFLDLETQLKKEKMETLAARAPLSFNDVVC